MPLILVALTAAIFASCNPQPKTPRAEDMQAGVLLAAGAVKVANDACVKRVDAMRVAANALEDQSKRLEGLKKAKALNDDCAHATTVARDVLEAAEAAITGGELLADGRAGCAIAKGLDAAGSICSVLRREQATCPKLVDDAIRFGTPLAAIAVGGCK